MSRKIDVFKSSTIFQVRINNKLVEIEKSPQILNKLTFNQFFDYLDINSEGIVFNDNSCGLLTDKVLMVESIENYSTYITIHSIVGGG